MLSALALIRRFWKPLSGVLAVLGVVGAVLLYGSSKYDQGVSDERARQAENAVAAAESRSEVDQAISRLPDGSALDELRKHWARD